MISGFILVGGGSSRMRRDKALLEWYQQPLYQHLAGILRLHCTDVRLLGSDRPEFRGTPVLPDAFPGAGPLGGLVTALEAPGPDWRLIVSCDMPLIDSALIRELISHLESCADVVLPETPDGRLHPLCALWHRRAGSHLRNYLQSVSGSTLKRNPQFSVQRFLSSLTVNRVAPKEFAKLRNINTMRDYLAALAGRRAPDMHHLEPRKSNG